MRCLSCKYDLSHLAGPPHRCAECGRAFDPADPNTFFWFRRRPLWLMIGGSLILGWAITVAGLFIWGSMTTDPNAMFGGWRIMLAAALLLSFFEFYLVLIPAVPIFLLWLLAENRRRRRYLRQPS